MIMKKFIRAFLALIVLTLVPLAHADAVGSGAVSGYGKPACETNYTRVGNGFCALTSSIAPQTISSGVCTDVTVPANTKVAFLEFIGSFIDTSTALVYRRDIVGLYSDPSCTTAVNTSIISFTNYSTGSGISNDGGTYPFTKILAPPVSGHYYFKMFYTNNTANNSVSVKVTGYYDN